MNVTYSDFKRRKNKGCNKCSNDYTKIWDSRIGKQYRDLLLVSYEGDGMCKFNCSCGVETIKQYYDVESGKVTSCGHNKENQKLEDLTGVQFKYLTAIENRGFINNQVHYLFKCICGSEIVRMAKEVKRGKIGSCGCMMHTNVGAKPKHGLSKDRLYGIYKGMIRRCYSEHDSSYQYYGGRGIVVCDEWIDEEVGVYNFYEWALTNGYHKNLTIDRINVSGNYEPDNCRWADALTQANNKTNNVYFEYEGEELTLTEWGRKLNLNPDSLWKRIYKYNYTFEKAITYKTDKIQSYDEYASYKFV